MGYTYCMTSHCALSELCARYEADAARHLLSRTYADFSEALIRERDSAVACPFFIDKNDGADGQAKPH
jgi:hypothetical protein